LAGSFSIQTAPVVGHCALRCCFFDTDLMDWCGRPAGSFGARHLCDVSLGCFRL
jgi:hypothetical protein